MEDKKRLIDANEPINAFKRYAKNHPYATWNAFGIEEVLNSAKTVDAVEVVHGRWMPGYPISCSVCGGAAATDYEDANRYEAWITPYCPNCGAKMDGEKNNEN